MSYPIIPPISISMGQEDCNKLIRIIDIYAQGRNQEWKEWAKQISQIIESEVRTAGSEKIPVISFQLSNWNAFSKIIQETCRSLDNDWQQWASRMNAEIQKTVNSVDPSATSASTGLKQDSSTGNTEQKRSKADELYEKGSKSFLDSYRESDKDKRSGYLSRAHGYLTMAYKAAGDDLEDKKGIAGLMAIILTDMRDYKNAETWARAEFSINPSNVFARLAWYSIELDKLVDHKGFVTQNDGSGFGIFANILTTGIDLGRVQGKKNVVRTAAIEAARAIENAARTEAEPDPGLWLLWSAMLLSIIDNMWTNNMKEPYLCTVLLSLPWNRFTDEQIRDLQEAIEEIQVEAHGFLGRLR